MRRARGLRVSSTRDVCIFCATRRLAAESTPISSLTSHAAPQRRHLNYSSKAPQYAAAAHAYQEDTQTLTLAQRQRQALARSQNATPFQQPSVPSGGSSLAERQRAKLQATYRQQPPPPNAPSAAPQMQPQSHAATNNWVAGNRPAHQRPRANSGGDLFRKMRTSDASPRETSRYRVNYAPGARAPADTPQFGAGNLRRRGELRMSPTTDTRSAARETQSRPYPIERRKLNKEELDRILKLETSGSAPAQQRPAVRFTRVENSSVKCIHCGDSGHRSENCLRKPAVRRVDGVSQSAGPSEARVEAKTKSQPPVAQRAQDSQRWVGPTSAQDLQQTQRRAKRSTAQNVLREDGTIGKEEPQDKPEEVERISERRRARFAMNDEQHFAPRNTAYDEEQPRRRERTDRRVGRGNRVLRDMEEEDEVYVGKAERKRQRREAKKAAQLAKAEPTKVYLPEYISVANLASVLKLRVEDFVRKLEELGFEDVQNDHILNAEHAGLVAQEYNFEPVIQVDEANDDLCPAPAPTPEVYASLPTRPPVVTIMGHVDHGKTTILDYMRSSSVAASEFGGITQHIGAFSVPLANGKNITFLDTPGHAAFETMRARGANVTDVVVLVIAADDSVKPQTVEAIKHAQAAGVPMIVAINKIDKQEADPERVKKDLGRYGIEVEDFGGDVQTVSLSGKTGQGIPDLEEAISTLSEILDHRADPQASVEGWVLEGTTKKSGRVATVLVRSGTLRVGDTLVAGTTWTRVRSLRNEAGALVTEVGPGMPAEVDGWREQPRAGDEVLQAPDEQKAAAVAELRMENVERLQMAKDMEAINEARRLEAERREAADAAKRADEAGETISSAIKESGPDIVSFIIKADVSGSVEAVVNSVSAIGNNEIGTRILRSGVGSPSEFDIQHAADAQGHIINFNTPIPPHIAAMAEKMGVRILDSNIIYRVVENVKALLSENLTPKVQQRVVGEAEVAAIFEIGMGGKRKMCVAGSKVRNGIVEKKNKVRVLRGDEVIFDGQLSSLKNQKKDVESMRKDTECGLAFEGFDDFQVGDKVQSYTEIVEKRSL